VWSVSQSVGRSTHAKHDQPISMMRLQRDDTGDSLLNNGPRSEYVKKYPEHPIGQRAKSFKPQQEIQGAVGPIESLTSQKKDYQEYPIEKRRAFRPTNERVELEPFDGHTSHRDEYPEWELPRKREIARQPWNPPEVPLDTTTSQRHDYPEHPTARRENFKPSHSPKDTGRFEGHTSNRDDYLEWQLPEKHKRATIQWQPPEVPMDANTTNKHDFQEHQISPRVQYRADYQPVNGGWLLLLATVTTKKPSRLTLFLPNTNDKRQNGRNLLTHLMPLQPCLKTFRECISPDRRL